MRPEARVAEALATAVRALPPRALTVGGMRPIPAERGDRSPMIEPCPRLIITLAGEHRYIVSRRGERVEAVLRPGEALHLATRAWAVPARRRPCRFLGVVFRQTYLRVIVAEFVHGATTPRVEHLHTRRPLAGAGALALRALDDLAERGSGGEAAVDLFCAAMRLAQEHLARDLAAGPDERPSAALWRSTLELLHQRYADPIGREQVARELGVHPNYLSGVCREHGGVGFQEALEGIRLAHARHLVATTQLPLQEIAARSGYSSAGYLVRVFRLRTGITPGRLRRGR
jgi:AraC-like DNA-binding protein